MNKIPDRRRSGVALLESWHYDRLLNTYLRRYSDCESFVSAFHVFADTHRAVAEDFGWSAPFSKYGGGYPFLWGEMHEMARHDCDASSHFVGFVTAFESFAHNWKLDLLPGERGYEALLSALRYSYALEPQTPYLIHMRAYDIPHVPGEEWTGDNEAYPLRVCIMVEIDDFWNPRHQDRSRTRKRLLNRVRDQVAATIDPMLEEIAGIYERHGMTTRDTESALDQNLDCLFRRVVLGEHVDDIAESVQRASKTIRDATDNLSKRLGIMTIPRSKRRR